MTAKKSSVKHILSILICSLLLISAIGIFIGAIQPCQAQTQPQPISVAPGMLIRDFVVLGNSEPGSDLSIIPPTIDNSLWILDPRTNPNTRHCITPLVIHANSNWILFDHVDPSDGHAAYEGTKLTEPMIMIAGGYLGKTRVDLSNSDDLLATGIGGDKDVVIPLTFEQSVTGNDQNLPNGHSYELTITFTVSLGILE